MHGLLITAGLIGVGAAGAALWLQRRHHIAHRWFAGLIALAVTASLFSVIAWAATAVARIAPLPLTLVLVGTLAIVFAVRLYRELKFPPTSQLR
jgi:hypothetical protein